jgi:methionine-rich copper-binding protein CopC
MPSKPFKNHIAAALLQGVPVLLSAHMKFEKATPAPDSTVSGPVKTIQLWFSESPDPKVSKVDVVGPRGPLKASGLHAMDKSLMVMLDGPTPAGAYTVTWQSAGDDGHVQKGEFKFKVAAAGQP